MDFSIKYKLKYYKFSSNDDTIVLNVGLNGNHDVSEEILSDLRRSINRFFEKLYIDDSTYKIKQEGIKNEQEYQRKQEKKAKEYLKQNKK